MQTIIIEKPPNLIHKCVYVMLVYLEHIVHMESIIPHATW